MTVSRVVLSRDVSHWLGTLLLIFLSSNSAPGRESQFGASGSITVVILKKAVMGAGGSNKAVKVGVFEEIT
jgi:hypothetical protein